MQAPFSFYLGCAIVISLSLGVIILTTAVYWMVIALTVAKMLGLCQG